MLKAHRIRLNPAPEQASQFMRAAGVARFAYNWALAGYKRQKDAGERVDWNALKKEFRASIDAQFPFVREVTKCAAEEGIADCRRAIATYYRAKAKNQKLRFPGARKRSRRIGGFGLANDKFRLDGHQARLPKVGSVNLAEPLRFVGAIVSGRVTERAGRWYLTVVVDVAAAPLSPLPSLGGVPAAAVGIDFGLHRFATLSTGEGVETQALLRRSEGKLKRLQRGLVRKQNGSKNRAKWKLRVARQHERVRNQRVDFLHKFTTEIVRRFGVVCVEDLCLAGLCRTRLAKSFQDAGIGEALRQLEYKLGWSGGQMVQVGRFFPSSKRCHACGAVYVGLTLAERAWRCPGCGTQHERDVNAAVNIELEGLTLLAGNGSLGGTPVEPSASIAGFGGRQAEAVKQELDGAHLCAPER